MAPERPLLGSRSRSAAVWLRANGGTVSAVARSFGVTRQSVSASWSVLYPGVAVPAVGDVEARRARVRDLALAGGTPSEIADAAQVTPATVRRILRSMDLGHQTERARRRAAVDVAVRSVGIGVRVPDAAAAVGVPESSLRARMRKRGVRASASAAQGRMDGRSLRAADRVLRGGETVPAACAAEGCSTARVYAILRKRRKRSA